MKKEIQVPFITFIIYFRLQNSYIPLPVSTAMAYSSLEACLLDLEKNGHLVRIKEEVDPYLQMAAIHLKVFEAGGPALLFENVKGTKYRASFQYFRFGGEK